MAKKRKDGQKRKLQETAYANTDLKIMADEAPSALKAAFDRHGYCDLWERQSEEGQWEGTFETAKQYNKPDPNLADFLTVIETLEAAELSQWEACTLREFDIGYHAGLEPFSFSQSLSEETIRGLASVGASLRITVYAPEKPKLSQRKPSQKTKKLSAGKRRKR